MISQQIHQVSHLLICQLIFIYLDVSNFNELICGEEFKQVTCSETTHSCIALLFDWILSISFFEVSELLHLWLFILMKVFLHDGQISPTDFFLEDCLDELLFLVAGLKDVNEGQVSSSSKSKELFLFLVRDEFLSFSLRLSKSSSQL